MAALSYDVVSVIMSFTAADVNDMLRLSRISNTWLQGFDLSDEVWDRLTLQKWGGRRAIRPDGERGIELFRRRMIASRDFKPHFRSVDLHPIEDCCNALEKCKNCPMFIEGLHHSGRMASKLNFTSDGFDRPPVLRCDSCKKDVHLVVDESSHDRIRKNKRFATLNYDDKPRFRYNYSSDFEGYHTGPQGHLVHGLGEGVPTVMFVAKTREIANQVMVAVANNIEEATDAIFTKRGYTILDELILGGKPEDDDGVGTMAVLAEVAGTTEDDQCSAVPCRPFAAPHRNPPRIIVLANGFSSMPSFVKKLKKDLRGLEIVDTATKHSQNVEKLAGYVLEAAVKVVGAPDSDSCFSSASWMYDTLN